MYQNVTIGGQTADKKDAVNELSFLCRQFFDQCAVTQGKCADCFNHNQNRIVEYVFINAVRVCQIQGCNRNAPVFPEYTLEFVLNELDLFEKRDGDVFYITEDTKDGCDTMSVNKRNKERIVCGAAGKPKDFQCVL